jgi:hypothetical protein
LDALRDERGDDSARASMQPEPDEEASSSVTTDAELNVPQTPELPSGADTGPIAEVDPAYRWITPAADDTPVAPADHIDFQITLDGNGDESRGDGRELP